MSSQNSLSNELDLALAEAGHGSDSSTAFLVGLGGKHAGKLFRIQNGESLIGRTSKSIVQLAEKAVSHQHATLVLGPEGCTLTDLNSTNGSYVNDVRIKEPTTLQAGDVIRFGTSILGYLTDAEDEGQHTRALARITQPNLGAAASSAFRDEGGLVGTRTSESPSFVASARGQIVSGGAAQIVPAVAGEAGLTSSQSGAPLGAALAPTPLEKLDSALDKAGVLWTFLLSYRWALIFGALAMATLAASTVAIMPPRAVATFEVFLRGDRVQDTARQFATRDVDFFEFADKHFSSPELVEKTMKEMGLPGGPGNLRATRMALGFETAGFGTVRGEYRHQEARFAEKFLAQHLKNFLEYEIGRSINVISNEVELLRDEYQKNQTNLKKFEDSLRDYKKKHLDALPENAQTQLGSRVELLERRDVLSADLERFSKELELSKKQLKSEDVFVESRVNRAAHYEKQLAEVRTEIAAAKSSGLSSEHPDLRRLRGQEKELEKLTSRTVSAKTTEIDRRANPEHKRLANRTGELGVAVSATQKELGLVQKRLSEIEDIAGDMPGVEAEVAEKMRAVAVSRRHHDRLYDQLKAKELKLEFERNSVAARYEVIRPPHAWPVTPVKTAVFRAIVGLILGLCLAFGGAVLHRLLTYARERSVRLSEAPPAPVGSSVSA